MKINDWLFMLTGSFCATAFMTLWVANAARELSQVWPLPMLLALLALISFIFALEIGKVK